MQTIFLLHFISNIDGAQLSTTLKKLNLGNYTIYYRFKDLFTTQETMANARAARKWFLAQGGGEERYC